MLDTRIHTSPSKGGQDETQTQTKYETYEVRGEEVVAKVKELTEKGGLGKISILDKRGRVLAVFPVTAGLVGVLLAPMLAAVGAIAAIVTKCTIRVERKIKRLS